MKQKHRSGLFSVFDEIYSNHIWATSQILLLKSNHELYQYDHHSPTIIFSMTKLSQIVVIHSIIITIHNLPYPSSPSPTPSPSPFTIHHNLHHHHNSPYPSPQSPSPSHLEETRWLIWCGIECGTPLQSRLSESVISFIIVSSPLGSLPLWHFVDTWGTFLGRQMKTQYNKHFFLGPFRPRASPGRMYFRKEKNNNKYAFQRNAQSKTIRTDWQTWGTKRQTKGSPHSWKKRFFVKSLHKMVTPPPSPFYEVPIYFFSDHFSIEKKPPR